MNLQFWKSKKLWKTEPLFIIATNCNETLMV